MQWIIIAITLMSASLAITTPSGRQTIRSPDDLLPFLKRDPSGQGFAHLGSDNVLRTFDNDSNVIDFAPLDSRAWLLGDRPRIPSDVVLNEAMAIRIKSMEALSKARLSTGRQARGPRNIQIACENSPCYNDVQCSIPYISNPVCNACFMVGNTSFGCRTIYSNEA